MISINTKIISTKRGSNGFNTFSMLDLATPTPMNNTDPTGGVHNPMQRLRTIMIPKWIGFILRLVTTGRNIGVKINTAGVMSMNIPTNNRMRLMINKMTILFSLNVIRLALTVCGISAYDMPHDILIDVPISNMTTAVVPTELRNIY